MDQREQQDPASEIDHPVAKASPQPDAAPTQKPATHSPGGKDALGKKENLLAPFYDDMVAVAAELAPRFTPLGLHFRPEVLLATAMQEAANKDPLTNRSFDNGLGIMQITPYKGKLDAGVAAAIQWDNSKDIEYNIAHSNWRSARANLTAGAETMLGKARAIKRGVPTVWEQMDEPHRWRAVLFAYNAGESTATHALRQGGPNAAMISTFTNKKGEKVSHDYTAEIAAKMDYVDGHDPFAGAAPATTPAGRAPEPTPAAPDAAPAHHDDAATAASPIHHSVGRGGVNKHTDVRKVQQQLAARGIDPGRIDGDIGPKTIDAIEAFQEAFLAHADGLIEPGKTTAHHMFASTAKVTTKPKATEKAKPEVAAETKDKGATHEEPHPAVTAKPAEATHPKYDEIAKNFSATIAGSSLTWHQALYLPSWGRHAKPSDVTNASMDTVLANIEKQAAALQKVSDHFGKAIHVHCWLRPPAYNAQIGGAGNSAHLRGSATDFHMDGITAEAVRQVLKSKADLYPGSGEENVSWVHIDLEHHKWFHP
jgi:peptidoglycan hydrolase-like protein with peptidoglycan-binding domain